MVGRPIDEMVEINTRVPRGHHGFWQIIRKLDAVGPWGVPDVDAATNANRAAVSDFVGRLERGRISERAGTRRSKDGRSDVTLYRLLETPVTTPRIDRAGKRLREPTIQTLWRTMKMVKIFTMEELAELATTSEYTVPLQAAQRYVKRLRRAGVVVQISGEKPPRYRLVHDLGAHAPIILRTTSLYDPNARVVIGDGETIVATP